MRALASDDLDQFVVHDADNDGNFTNAEIVGASTTATSNALVELVAPADGADQVWVQGWSVAGNPQFTLIVDAIRGNDLPVTGTPAARSTPAGRSRSRSSSTRRWRWARTTSASCCSARHRHRPR